MESSWPDALDGFRGYLAGRGRRQVTWQTYAAYLRRLAVDHPDPWAVTADDLTAWLTERGTGQGQPAPNGTDSACTVSAGWSIETRRSALATLRVFYGWAVRAGHVVESPAVGLSSPVGRCPSGKPSPLLPDAWARAVDDFTTSLRAAGRSPRTIRLRRHYLHQLAGVAADPWAMTADQLAAWLAGPEWKAETRKSARPRRGCSTAGRSTPAGCPTRQRSGWAR